MTSPAHGMEDEVRMLIEMQIKIFKQPEPLTPAQLLEHHSRSEKIKMICHELDRIGAQSVLPRRWKRAS